MRQPRTAWMRPMAGRGLIASGIRLAAIHYKPIGRSPGGPGGSGWSQGVLGAAWNAPSATFARNRVFQYDSSARGSALFAAPAPPVGLFRARDHAGRARWRGRATAGTRGIPLCDDAGLRGPAALFFFAFRQQHREPSRNSTPLSLRTALAAPSVIRALRFEPGTSRPSATSSLCRNCENR